MAVGPSTFPFSVPAGLDINQNIGFAPTACVVANYSPYYIYLPDGLSFVPPWTSGAIVPLAHATQARATWSNSPFGAQTIAATASGITYSAQFTYTDDPNLSYSGGSIVGNPYATTYSKTGEWTGVAAGLYADPIAVLFPKVLALSAINTVSGSEGRLRVAIANNDGSGTQGIHTLFFSDSGNSIVIPFPDNFQWTNPDPAFVGGWKLYFTLSNLSGVGNYSFAYALEYSLV